MYKSAFLHFYFSTTLLFPAFLHFCFLTKLCTNLLFCTSAFLQICLSAILIFYNPAFLHFCFSTTLLLCFCTICLHLLTNLLSYMLQICFSAILLSYKSAFLQFCFLTNLLFCNSVLLSYNSTSALLLFYNSAILLLHNLPAHFFTNLLSYIIMYKSAFLQFCFFLCIVSETQPPSLVQNVGGGGDSIWERGGVN